MTNKEKFLALVSEKDTSFLQELNKRKENREMLRESQTIAFKVLYRLDELGWSQKKLAEKMNVSPQQISKIVKGQENLTLETMRKLQDILDVAILASYHENKQATQEFATFENKCKIVPMSAKVPTNYKDLGIKRSMVRKKYTEASSEYTPQMAL